MANETTTKFKVDIAELKKNFQEASRQIRLANSEFKAASSGLDNWSKSADGVSAKINQLNKTLDAQKTQLKSLEKQYALTVKQEGETSKGAQELLIKINNQKAAIGNTEKQIRNYNAKLTEMQVESEKVANKSKEVKTSLEKLTDAIDKQESELEQLKRSYANVVLEQGKNSREAKNLASQIGSLSDELQENKNKLSDAERAANELDGTLDETKKSAEKASDGFTVMKGALANLVADGVELALQGLKRLGEEIINVGKLSIGNYAEYEQLVGGVETLFGAGGKSLEDFAKSQGKTVKEVEKQYNSLMDAQTTVLKNADKAYQSAGLSANKYMETVTSFSAALISGLEGDTAKAAKVADMAIVDMSDNANKMGTDMASIQNAYQGFAKQNYTMLDNLKLGYGGTQKEMARLINDSGVLGNTMKVTEKNVNEVSFDKIIEAIHVVQDEMGITGTTSEEAAKTIEGSKNAMQAAWQNLLTGLANDDADLDVLFDNFVESLKTYGKNLLPRIEELVKNVVGFLKEQLQKHFPEAFATISAIVRTVKDDILPPLIDLFGAIVSIIKDDVFPILKTIAKWLVDNLLPVIKELIGWIVDNKDIVIAGITGIAAAFAAWKFVGLITAVTTALQAMSVAEALAAAKTWLLNAALAANPIGLIIAAVVGLVTAFIVLWKKSDKFRNFWIGLWDKLKKTVIPFFKTLINYFQSLWKTIQPIVIKIWDFLKVVIKEIVELFKLAWEAIKAVWDFVKPYFEMIWKNIKAIFSVVVSVLGGYFKVAWEVIKTVWDVAVKYFTLIWENIKTVFSAVVHVLGAYFKAAWDNIKIVWDVVVGYFKMIWNNIKLIFGVVKDVLSGNFGDAWDKIKQIWGNVAGWFGQVWDGIKGIFGNVVGFFQTAFSEAWTAIKGVFSNVGEFFGGMWDTIKGHFTAIGTAIGDAVGGAFKAVINGALTVVENTINAGIKLINKAISIINDIPGVDIDHVPEVKFKKLAKGGIVNKPTFAQIGEDGKEAVIPLEKNTGWLDEIAKRLSDKLGNRSIYREDTKQTTTVNNNFYQTNNSPKSLSRLEIYRQSKNLLNMKGV